MTTAPADLGEGDLLDKVDVLRQTQLETSAALLQLVAEFARQHDAGTVDPVAAQLPGRERAVRLGGEGTPQVAEFAPAVLAARMGLSAYAGGRLVADVLDLQYRLPLLWARAEALEVAEGHARYVARKTRNLTPEEAARVAARIAPSADGRVSWTRFETLLEAAIVAADPEAAAAREHAAARETFAKATRSTEHGMRSSTPWTRSPSTSTRSPSDTERPSICSARPTPSPSAPTPPGSCRSTTPSPGPDRDPPPALDNPASATTAP